MLSSSAWKSIAQLVIVVMAALAVPALICRSKVIEHGLRLRAVKGKRVLLASGGVHDIPSGQTLLRKANASWVVIGNSMMNSRFESAYLSQISGQRAFKLTASGTNSVMWYLFLRQIVAEVPKKPQVVTIVFRDRNLTWTDFRMHRNEEMVERMDGRSLPEWDTVMGDYDLKRSMSYAGVVRGVTGELQQLIPGEKLRNWGRWKMQKIAFGLTEVGEPVLEEEDRRDERNDRLSYDHQRQDGRAPGVDDDGGNESEETKPGERNGVEPIVFDSSHEHSFLPHMIDLAKKHGFVLHFHRVKRRPSDGIEPVDDAALTAYLDASRVYVEGQGCVFSDESKDTTLTEDMYIDGDHLRREPQFQEPYMRNFWQRVQPLLAPKFKAPVAPTTPPAKSGRSRQSTSVFCGVESITGRP
jgi:hypothetical protein